MEPIVERPFLLDMELKGAPEMMTPDGVLHLVGYGSTFERDRDRETITPQAFRTAVERYMRNPILLNHHNQTQPIGRVTKAVVDDRGVLIEAEIPPPPPGTEPWHVKVYHDVKNGLIRSFSLGGLFRRDAKDRSRVIDMDLCEFSVVPIPANPSSLFAVVQKSFQLPETAGRTAEYDLTKLRTDAFTRAVDSLPRA